MPRTADDGDDLLGVLFLGVDPASHLVDVLCAHGGAELVNLHHRLADGGARLLDLFDSLWENTKRSGAWQFPCWHGPLQRGTALVR